MSILDTKLSQTVEYLKANWYEPRTGIVAACLFDRERDISVFATSSFVKDQNRWRHAEFNAMREFKDKFGHPSSNSVMIVTLSPCIQKTSSSRLGSPCAQVLIDNGIYRIHFGNLDTKQGEMKTYEDLGFRATQSNQSELVVACDNIAGLFKEYGHMRLGDGNPWPDIKKIIGHSVFKR